MLNNEQVHVIQKRLTSHLRTSVKLHFSNTNYEAIGYNCQWL